MHELTEETRGLLASTREAEQRPPEGVALKMIFHNTFSVGFNHRLSVVTDARERVIGGGDQPMHDPGDKPAAATLLVGSTAAGRSTLASPSASEQLRSRAPFAEDGVFIVDTDSRPVLEVLPLATQRGAEQINGDAGHNTRTPQRVEILHDGVGDITPHTRLLRRARKRVKALAAANRRKDEFLATLSHELRTPLASIQYALRLLSTRSVDASAGQEAQALMERQVRGMTRLVDDLLDLSWITHGRLRLRRERVDLRLIVNNAIETLQADIKERKHHLVAALTDSPVWLQADSTRLEQVFANLLANASKYTDAGGELAVWMHTQDDQVVVRIRDSGIGIAPDALPRIFDLFRQTNEADDRSLSGLGIGLALVRNLVEAHGGSVTASSAGLGKGSEFTVRLPHSGEVTPVASCIPS